MSHSEDYLKKILSDCVESYDTHTSSQSLIVVKEYVQNNGVNVKTLLKLNYFCELYLILIRPYMTPQLTYIVLHIMCNLSAAYNFLSHCFPYTNEFVEKLVQFIPLRIKSEPTKYTFGIAESSCWILSNILKESQVYIHQIYSLSITWRIEHFYNLLKARFTNESKYLETLADLIGCLTSEASSSYVHLNNYFLVILCDLLQRSKNASTLHLVCFALCKLLDQLPLDDYKHCIPDLVEWLRSQKNFDHPRIAQASAVLMRAISNIADEFLTGLIDNDILDLAYRLLRYDPLCKSIQLDLLFSLSNFCTTLYTERIDRLLSQECFDTCFERTLHRTYLVGQSNNQNLEHLRLCATLILNARDDQLSELVARGMTDSVCTVLCFCQNKDFALEFITATSKNNCPVKFTEEQLKKLETLIGNYTNDRLTEKAISLMEKKTTIFPAIEKLTLHDESVEDVLSIQYMRL